MAEDKKQKAVFLDRDGTINEDFGYVCQLEDLKFLPNVVAGLKLLQARGYKLIIITNQSGIARGYYSIDDYHKLTSHMLKTLKEEGVRIDDIYYCPHGPEERCSCRKPSPKMVIDAAEKHNIKLEESFFVGDKEADIRTGKAAGCKTIMVLTGQGKNGLGDADHDADDLLDAARWIIDEDAYRS